MAVLSAPVVADTGGRSPGWSVRCRSGCWSLAWSSLAEAVSLGALIGPAQVATRGGEIVSKGRHHPFWTLVAAAVLTTAGLGLLATGPSHRRPVAGSLWSRQRHLLDREGRASARSVRCGAIRRSWADWRDHIWWRKRSARCWGPCYCPRWAWSSRGCPCGSGRHQPRARPRAVERDAAHAQDRAAIAAQYGGSRRFSGSPADPGACKRPTPGTAPRTRVTQ
jgi:hypothetical protein